MSDRIAGLFLTAITLTYVIAAGDYVVAYGGPVGPSTFPRIVGIPAVVLAASLIVWPSSKVEWPRGRRLAAQVAALATLVGYALLLEGLGFIPATILEIAVIALLMGTSPQRATALGVAGSFVLYGLFDLGLGLPLPLLGSFFG